MFMQSYIKVKGHQRSSCKMCSKWLHLIWKVVRLEPNLVYWYNVGTFTCSWGQRSQMKVKGHGRSLCKISWKCKIWHICILEDQLETCEPNRCGIKVRCQFGEFASSTIRERQGTLVVQRPCIFFWGGGEGGPNDPRFVIHFVTQILQSHKDLRFSWIQLIWPPQKIMSCTFWSEFSKELDLMYVKHNKSNTKPIPE